MTKLVIKRIADSPEASASGIPVYRWRSLSRNDSWLSASQEGSLQTLASQYPEAELILLCSGYDAGIRRYSFRRNERKHLARLLANELEPDLASDLSLVHTALGKVDLAAEQVSLAYIDKRWLMHEIEAIETVGFEVAHCVPEPLLVPGDQHNWHIVCDGEQLLFCWGKGLAVSIDLDMLAHFLDQLATQVRSQVLVKPAHIHLFATDQLKIERLSQEIEKSQFRQIDVSIQTQHVDDAWGVLLPSVAGLPDLRSGEFSRPVRWRKYWKPIRLPVMTSVAASLMFIVSALVEVQINNHRHQQLQVQIERVYRDVVPAGVLVDAEQQLRTQLAQFGRNGNTSRLMPALAAVSPALQQGGDLRLHRLNYSAAQGELQLGVSANSNADILALSERINQAGLVARAQNMSRVSDRQQASLLIQEVR